MPNYFDELYNINSNYNHQLEEIKKLLNNPHHESLVLLDDKVIKTNLSIDFLLSNDFIILLETKYQILLSKQDIK